MKGESDNKLQYLRLICGLDFSDISKYNFLIFSMVCMISSLVPRFARSLVLVQGLDHSLYLFRGRILQLDTEPHGSPQ